jgi:octaprenyl-diphosphate synthase
MSTVKTLEELYHPIQPLLDGVRETIGGLWRDALTLVRVEGMPMPKAGGKLLRPALCLLSAGAIGGKDLARYVRLAASFEALHIASLAHDDVIDRAILRRGNASLNALWDNHAAVLGGDYLVARSVQMLAEFDCCPVIANAITAVRCMAEGELHFFGREHEPITEEDCILLAEQKTATLFAEACSAPAFLLDTARREPLRRYGIALGIAFQIVDDLLDLTQPVSTLGKPSCGDIVEGKRTIPIMHLRAGLDEAGNQRIDALRNAALTENDQAWIAEMVEKTDARAITEAAARAYADRALDALRGLPASPYRDSMEGIVEFILVRAS